MDTLILVVTGDAPAGTVKLRGITFGVVVPPAATATSPVAYNSVKAALVTLIFTVPAVVEYNDTLCKFTLSVALKTIPQFARVVPVAEAGGADLPEDCVTPVEACAQYEVVVLILGVVKEPPVAKANPPVWAAYQVIVPSFEVADKFTVP